MINLATLNEGIVNGGRIDANHILRIVDALSGVTENEIIIKGSVAIVGPSSVEGTLTVKDIRVDRLLVNKNKVKIGDVLEVHNKGIDVSNLVGKHISASNLIVGNCTTINNLQELPNNTVFLSLDEKTNIIHFTRGSLREKHTPVDLHYRFNEGSLDDEFIFKGKINELSSYNTRLIDTVEYWAKSDHAPSWVATKSLDELQKWIDNNILGNRLDGTIYTIKIVVNYKQHESGKSEVVFRYTNT